MVLYVRRLGMARVFASLLGVVTPLFTTILRTIYITTVRANVDDFCLGSLKSGGASANEA